ncbi:hypothetical protein CR513_59309, partial [Mucuna pruriens]
MNRMFLEKFFPASRTTTIRKEICGIRQHFGETLHEFDDDGPKHIDATSGGALMDKTPTTTRHLISNMESNTQQFGIRGFDPSQMVNEIGAVDNMRLESELTELTSLVRQLAVGQHQPSIAARVCGICTSVEHPIDMCPTLQETKSNHPESVGTIGGIAIPTTATIESAISRQLTISRGPDEAVSNKQSRVPTKYEFQQHAVLAKYECHHPRPQDADRIAGQHYESSIVDWVQEPSLTINFESEGECKHSIIEKW